MSLKWITYLRGRGTGYGVTHFDVTSSNVVQTFGSEKTTVITNRCLAYFRRDELVTPVQYLVLGSQSPVPASSQRH